MSVFRWKMLRKIALSGGVLAMGLVFAQASVAQTTIKLGWATADSDTDPYAITAHYFAEELEKAAPDEYNVKFYGNHQLGDETQMLQGMQLGTIDMGVFTSTYVGNIVPAFQLNDLPFLYKNYDQARAVLGGEVGKMLFKKLDDKNMVGLGFAVAGFRNVINNKRPIKTPSDLSGVRLRVQPSDLFLDSFRALGANPVPMSWSDVFTAVQQGTIDGLEIPLAVIYANKYPEVTKYLSLTKHTYNALVLIMSKQTFKRLSDDQKEIVRQAASKAVERQRKRMKGLENGFLQKIEESGMQVNEVDDISAFRDRVSDIYQQYRGKVGPEIFDAAMKQTSN